MIRVLHVFGGLGTGGTESLIMSWYRNIDRTKIQFDFLVRSQDNNYVEEIKNLGGRVFYTASFPRHFVKNYKETKSILARKEWEIIHVHGNAAMYMLPLRLAKKFDYSGRIMHSHSVAAQSRAFTLIHKVNRSRLSKIATHYLACSSAAGDWMFSDVPYQLFRNAIDVKAYQYNSNKRGELRKELHIENKYVIGHVGRFVIPKNHVFLLETFAKIKKVRPESVLMLVGNGELEVEIKTKAEQLGIAESVLFMGRRTDVAELMSTMDIFVLPSLYEGLGIVLVEAQSNGLPCVVSEEAYNEEVNIYQDRLSVLPLSYGIDVWANQIINQLSFDIDRNVDIRIVQDCGYDMKTEIIKLEKFYLQVEKGSKA